jgi:hypothetical protein
VQGSDGNFYGTVSAAGPRQRAEQYDCLAGTPADFAIPKSEEDPGHEFNGQRGASHRDASAAPRPHRRGPHMGAERYQVGDVLRYSRASKETGIGKSAYVQVKSIDAPNNRLTVELQSNCRTAESKPTIRADSRASRFFERRCGVFQWATASSSPRRPTTSELRTASWASFKASTKSAPAPEDGRWSRGRA